MIYYEKEVQKAIRKGDIKKLKGNFKRDYFRLRKGKYRAIFYIDDNNFYIIYIGKRDEVYESWQ
jgi:mRNA interferase RelE/StbE